MLTRLKSPGMECFRQLAAMAKSSASWRGPAADEAEDQPTGEGITAADAVDDVEDVVVPPEVEAVAVPQAGGPTVDVGAAALAQRDGDGRQARVRSRTRCGESLVDGALELAGGHVGRRVDAQRVLAVLLVADGHVDVLHESAA